MICTNCGTEFEGKFCPSCGTRVVMEAQARPPVSTEPQIPAEPEVPAAPQAPAMPQFQVPAQPQAPVAPQPPAQPQFQMPVQPQAPIQTQPAFNTVQTFAPAAPAKKPVHKKWWFWTLIGIAALVLIIIVLGLIGRATVDPQLPDTPPVQLTEDVEESTPADEDATQEVVNMDLTVEPQEALKCAKEYLEYSAFSYNELIEWLEDFDDFCHADAVYAANNCGANWQDEALRKAKEYLSDGFGFSYASLMEELQEFDKFTYSQAKYAADNCNANWKYQAVVRANSYLDSFNFSYESLLDQLEIDEFSREEAKYGVDNCGANWNEQAARIAKDLLSYDSYTRSELIEALEHEGFTRSQAIYGADANNITQ